jgi:hypothetical protein
MRSGVTRAIALVAILSGLLPRSVSAQTQWAPPIGIPAPSFGIFEQAPPSPSPWTNPTPGFYYVDASQPGSTDSSNPYGTPSKPRATIPTALPAGAVVELHGTYDASHSSPDTIVASGTAARPVFIRGVSASSRPLVRRTWEIDGTYFIVENIEFGPLPDQSDTGALVMRLPISHAALRHSELHGTLQGGGLGIVNWEVAYGEIYTGPGVIEQVVIYDNIIHDNGDVNADYDQDVHGIGVSDHVQYLWVVDNQMYRNSGDGIQINAGGDAQKPTTHHIYVGRNVSHNNKQTGFWTKQATDVIFSQNEAYAARPGNSGIGVCIGGQYAPDWVWFLYNHVHDCEYGIGQVSDDGQQTHTFIIGNVVDNIHRSQASDPTDAWSPSGIMMSGGYERHIVNNTVYNVDSGVNIASPVGSLDVADNIIANVTQPQASHLLLNFSALAANTAFHNNILFGDPRIDYGNGQTHVSASLLAIAKSLDADPQFIDPTNRDFHVAASSPAANNGELNVAYATFQQRYGLNIAVDADGHARPQTATADIGAYIAGMVAATPSTPAPPSPPAAPSGGCTPDSIPSAPLGLTLVSEGAGTLQIAWNRPACGVPTSYIIEGATSPGGQAASKEIDASQTTYAGPLAAGTFYIRVQARNALGIGDPSNEIQVGGAPGAPRGLTVSATARVLTLSWSAPTDGGTLSGYIVEVGSAPGLADISQTTYPATTTAAIAVVPGGTSYVRVRAVSVAGPGAASNEVKITVR